VVGGGGVEARPMNSAVTGWMASLMEMRRTSAEQEAARRRSAARKQRYGESRIASGGRMTLMGSWLGLRFLGQLGRQGAL